MSTLPAIAARHAPTILLDEREPFPPLCAGVSVLRATADSPSFQRVVEIEPPTVAVVEYAVWFEWDITHLNELEHVWLYLDDADDVLGCEGSWHGFYQGFAPADGLVVENGHPILYAKPGKHAFAATPAAFEETRAACERDCGAGAGSGGVLATHLTLGKLDKSAESDALVRAYLRRRAFAPAWRFTRRVALTPELLVPWTDLAADIPRRVNARLARLQAVGLDD